MLGMFVKILKIVDSPLSYNIKQWYYFELYNTTISYCITLITNETVTSAAVMKTITVHNKNNQTMPVIITMGYRLPQC